MTSTKHNIGMNAEEKTSAKILKPPGGECHDIFGEISLMDEYYKHPVPHCRILKPPGGGSSDIFGTSSAQENSALAAEYKNKNSGKDTSQRIFGVSTFGSADTPRKVKDYLKSNVFAEAPSYGDVENVGGDVTDVTKNEINTSSAGGGEITENTSLNSDPNPISNPNKNKGIGNPITGEGYKADDIETEKVARHPAVRVRNPPGGPSTKLW